MNYGNYIYNRYQYYFFNVDLFFLWSCILRCVWWFVCLGIFLQVVLELTVSACVHMFWEF